MSVLQLSSFFHHNHKAWETISFEISFLKVWSVGFFLLNLQRKEILMMQKEEIKPYLIERLKQENAFWSYNVDAIKDVPDDILVELVLLHLDMDDIERLFVLYSSKFVKKTWIENVVTLGDRYYVLNKFFAWYYFHAKNPGAYVKSMETRQLNKKLAA